MLDLYAIGRDVPRRPTPLRPSWRSSRKRRTRSPRLSRACAARPRATSSRSPTTTASSPSRRRTRRQDRRDRRQARRRLRRRGRQLGARQGGGDNLDFAGTIFEGAAGSQGFSSARRSPATLSPPSPQERDRRDVAAPPAAGKAARQGLRAYVDHLGLLTARRRHQGRQLVKAAAPATRLAARPRTRRLATASATRRTARAHEEGRRRWPRQGRSRRGRPVDARRGQECRHARRQGPTPARTAPAQALSWARAPAARPRATPTTPRTPKSTPSPAIRSRATTRGCPPRRKAPTKKAEGQKAMDDDSTNGAQSGLPPKANVPDHGQGGTHRCEERDRRVHQPREVDGLRGEDERRWRFPRHRNHLR